MKISKRSKSWPYFTFRGFLLLLFFSLTGCGGGGGGGGGDGVHKVGTGLPVTITGTLRYEDRAYDEDGFFGTTLKPIRKAAIEVVREADGEVLTAGATEANGNYSLTFTNKEEAGVYVRVLAQTADNTVIVKNNSGLLYAITSLVIDDTAAGSFDLDLTARVTAGGGVFNILDVFLEGAEFVTTFAGVSPPPVTALWASGSCDGTYFDPADDTIHILGGCDNDTDEYDDSVLLHEYGHFIARYYSQDHSPGGSHYLSDRTQDIRLSWSEGWGNFFASAVRGDPLYVDTEGNVANIAFELEGLTSPMVPDLPSWAVYTTSELSVAAVLWDIFDDSPNEIFTNVVGTDSLSAGMAPIWDVAAAYLCPACSITTVSFEDFWDGWFARGHGLQAEMETISLDRLMALRIVGFEPDEDPPSGSVVSVNGEPTPTNTLYPAQDLDHFLFFASDTVPHTVETRSLTNGADTFIEVLDTDAISVLGSNDNANGATYSSSCGVNFFTQLSNCPPNDDSTLSSKVTFTPPAPGTYYVRVKRSAAAPPSAGTYGGYQIQVAIP